MQRADWRSRQELEKHEYGARWKRDWEGLKLMSELCDDYGFEMVGIDEERIGRVERGLGDECRRSELRMVRYMTPKGRSSA